MIFSVTFVAILTTVGLGNNLDNIWFKTKNSGSIDARTQNVVDSYTSLSTFQMFPANDMFIKFQIKACADAFVLLSAVNNLQSPNFYEICIGGGSNAIIILRIRRNGFKFPEYYQFYVSGLLSCSELKTFIVNWEVSGRITLTAETGIAMDWTDISPIPMKGVGLMTGWGSDGMWIVEHSCYYCGVTGTYGNMTLLSTSIGISVTRCSSECALSDDCLGINFNHKTKECQFVAGGQPVIKSVAHDWKFYTKCLKEKILCLGCIV
ncbi:unnamed protein product [Mytilus coruscus]|uniref:Uncharacterized protein n=1 Tax=Mytilus coruscus TaxID=42192 RepID=A0A6J8DEP4_MYTCO|nr:unnamed protein product [Mytilus coruscus]